ncbi:MAG: glycosyltransferase [Candidatus Daviesbacteria bacterium]|nr:glycosyltransferase [Candidatus Daviesbacteria bacterium]
MNKISIVIPYWNGVEKIKKHLPKVLEFAKVNNIEEIIACDDASTDETVKLLKTDFPEVQVVERKINQGFASNVNSGFLKITGDFVFLLNSDASPENDALKSALPHFEDPKVFSVGCNVGGLWAVGRFENGYFWHDQGSFKGDKLKSHQTLWSSGGSGIFRKTIWDELGGLDELYNPFYVEDVDLGYRATKRGYINIWEPESKVEHYQEKGVIEANFKKEKINNIAERNSLIFIWKNITSEKLMNEHKKALIKRLISHPKYWAIFLAAVRKYPEIMEKREVEKKYAHLTDEDIFNIFSKSQV